MLTFSPHIARILRLPLSATEIILGAIIAYFGFIGKSEKFCTFSQCRFLLSNVYSGYGGKFKSLF